MNPSAIRSILIINLGGMGDILLSSPAVRALLSACKGAEVAMLTSPSGKNMAEWLFPGVETREFFVHGYAVRPRLLAHNLETIAKLRSRRYELAVNMRTLVTRESAFLMKALVSMLRARTTAGRDTDGRGCFFDVKVPETGRGDRAESLYDIDTVEALHIKVEDTTIRVNLSEAR